MRLIKTFALLCMLTTFAVCSGCSKHDGAMPLEKDIVVKYLNKTAKNISDESNKNTSNDEMAQRKFVTDAMVKPMEELGYNYDKTINNFAKKVLARDMPVNDSELVTNINDILIFANEVKGLSLKNGQITKETKGLLDQLAQSRQLRGSFPTDK